MQQPKASSRAIFTNLKCLLSTKKANLSLYLPQIQSSQRIRIVLQDHQESPRLSISTTSQLLSDGLSLKRLAVGRSVITSSKRKTNSGDGLTRSLPTTTIAWPPSKSWKLAFPDSARASGINSVSLPSTRPANLILRHIPVLIFVDTKIVTRSP